MHRLSELEQNQQQRRNVGQHELSQEEVTIDDLASKSVKTGNRKGVVGFKDRVACFQWTWFTSTMATGGIANVLASSTLLAPQRLQSIRKLWLTFV